MLAVGNRLKGAADGNLRFSEAHIATNQPVHRHFTLHVLFHRLGSRHLIGSIFIDKRRFELGLQVRIGRKGKAPFFFTFGIKRDQIFGNILHLFLGALLHLLPGTGSQLVYLGFNSLFAFVFGNAMQRLDAHEQHITVAVNQANSFLYFSVNLGFHQTRKFPDPMIDVHHIVSLMQLVQLFQRDAFLLWFPGFQLKPMVSLKNLVISVATKLKRVIDKPFVQGEVQIGKLDIQILIL